MIVPAVLPAPAVPTPAIEHTYRHTTCGTLTRREGASLDDAELYCGHCLTFAPKGEFASA